MRVLSLILSIGLISLSLLAQPDPIHHISFETVNGNFADDVISGSTVEIQNDYPKPTPEFVTGISGQGLRFNGFATQLDGDLPGELPSQEFTLSFWMAIEAYPVGTAGIFNRFDGAANQGLFISMNKFGLLTFRVVVNGTSNTITTSQPISKFEWHHMVWSISTSNGQMEVYLNGNLLSNRSINLGTIDYPTLDPKFRFGVHVQPDFVGIFNVNHFNGIIDEIKFFDQALSDGDVSRLYNEFGSPGEPDLDIPDSRMEGDFHRPLYHAIPPAAWTNEPHGLVYHNGMYHLFYQKNANGPYWSNLNWGHQSSPDLVNWTEQRPVLTPEPGYDQGGCWSGVTLIDDLGNPMIFYTGVDGATAQVAIAIGDQDLNTFEKYTGNPVIATPPAPYTSNDFRDPYIWKENETWYLVIGSGLGGQGNSGGAALLYKSTDLIDWDYIDVFHKGFPDVDDSGVFWELPVVWQFDDKYLLLVVPIPQPDQPARMLYWTGDFVNEEFVPDDIQPKQLGVTNGMLAPTIYPDEDGRLTAIGIIPDLLPPEEQRKNGWANLYTLPRIWSLTEDGILAQTPHPNLEKLRGMHHRFDNLEVQEDSSGYLTGISGRQLEIKATVNRGDATRVGFIVAQNPGQTEETRIFQDFLFDISEIDRSNSSTNLTVPKFPANKFLDLPLNEDVEFHIFLDGSALEVFINGVEAYATRIYPEDPESIHIDLYANGGTAVFKSLDIWEMKAMNDPTVSIEEVPASRSSSIIRQIYPNPFDSITNLELDLPTPAEVEVQLLDIQGRILNIRSLGSLPSGLQTHTINWGIETKEEGIFMLQVLLNNQVITTERIIHIK